MVGCFGGVAFIWTRSVAFELYSITRCCCWLLAGLMGPAFCGFQFLA
jgi:hypothetical protein